jgi:hypothetical protein
MLERRSAGVPPFQRSVRPPERDSGKSARLADILIPSLSLLALLCWLVLYRWYALLDHIHTPLYSFYAIRGTSRSQALGQTALVFLALPTIYCVTCCLISKAAKVSAAVKVATVLLIVGAAVVNIWLYPVGVPDVFTYLFELKLVYIYHENPYVVTGSFYAADSLARFAGFLDVPLSYGPAWVVISSLPAVLAGFDSLPRLLLAYKLFSLLWLAVGGLVVYAHHHDEKGRWLGVYSFLANPLVLFESVGNAHNDVLMTAFLLTAVLALRRGSTWAGPLATLSALVKWLAVPFLPLFVLAALRGGCKRERLFLSALGSLALAIAVSAPFWAGGRMIGGRPRSPRA